MAPVNFTILGEAASKANGRRIVRIGATAAPRVIKSAKARAFANAVKRQAPLLSPLLDGPLVVTAHLHYRTQRSDLDEAVLLDALQGRVYINDRQVREKHIYHGIDRENPRCEVEIRRLKLENKI